MNSLRADELATAVTGGAEAHVGTGDPPPTYSLRCLKCGRTSLAELRFRCDVCAGALEPVYALDAVTIGSGADAGEVYADLLPIAFPGSLVPGVMRRTPCRRAPALGAMIGLEDLWIKDETGQPTGSTKDRMAAVVVAVLREYGVEEFVSASTGNSSTALARAVRMAGGMRAHFFCGQQFAGRHRFVSDEWTMLHVIDGTFVSAAEEAMAFAQERGLRWEGGFFNWARREGLKLAYLEAIEQMDREPQHVFQAVSSGMGMLGAYKGVQELRALGRLDRTPALHMVQQDTCAPMVSGWRAGCLELTGEHVVRNPTGLALAILRGDGRASYPYLRAIAAGTHGDITSVTQRDLVEARDLLLECEGVQGCFATAAVVAAAAVAAKDGAIPADRTVLLNLTGGNE